MGWVLGVGVLGVGVLGVGVLGRVLGVWVGCSVVGVGVGWLGSFLPLVCSKT